MMTEYKKPIAEFYEFETSDVITASGDSTTITLDKNVNTIE